MCVSECANFSIGDMKRSDVASGTAKSARGGEAEEGNGGNAAQVTSEGQRGSEQRQAQQVKRKEQ